MNDDPDPHQYAFHLKRPQLSITVYLTDDLDLEYHLCVVAEAVRDGWTATTNQLFDEHDTVVGSSTLTPDPGGNR